MGGEISLVLRTRTRIRRYERSTAFTYESDACDTEVDAAPVTIRI